jgi:hypothetical protein
MVQWNGHFAPAHGKSVSYRKSLYCRVKSTSLVKVPKRSDVYVPCANHRFCAISNA